MTACRRLAPFLLFWMFAGCTGDSAAGVGEGLAQETADLLVFAPHPDDETLGCAGILHRAIAAGQRVKIVLFTNGDGFPAFAATLAKRPREELTPPHFLELARYRQTQAMNALAALGGKPEDLVFLGYPDAGLDQVYLQKGRTPFLQPFTRMNRTYGAAQPDYHSTVHGRPAPYTQAAVLADVVELIRTLKPREIYVTNEADTHRDHKAAFEFVRDAVKATSFQGTCRSYLIHGGPEWPWPKGSTPDALLEAHAVGGGRAPAGVPWPPPHRVSLTPAEAKVKRKAIHAHSTHLEGTTVASLVEEREYLESFIKGEEVFWTFPSK